MTTHPYPGLRPFTREETFIFFGREAHTHELVRILSRTRFLAVTGNSGSGKSSIVRTGLLDALDRGLMASAGTDWRLADFRPGDAPVDRLAEALLEALGFERFEGDVALTAAMLARGPDSVAELMRQARIAVGTPLPEDGNLLILVDQFEELFRFADHGGLEQAEHFINLLLASARQQELPVYVVITMRSDYLGDCGRFEGLAEAINRGQFLTPRMTREQAISAIEGPAAVFGAEIDDRLVNELVNDMGVRQDRLPLLQHILNLLWGRASAGKAEDEPVRIALEDYRALGGLEEALDAHAEEIFRTLDRRQQEIAAVLFRQLVEARSRGLDLRRPTRASEIMAISGCSLAELVEVVEAFRGPGRSFLMPPVGTEITPATVLDLSHESLIRGWKRLGEWTRLEREAADHFRRYRERSADVRAGRGALLKDAELAVALDWRQRVKPSPAWAARYGEGPDDLAQVLDYIQESDRQRRLRRTRTYGLVASLLVLATVAVSWIWMAAEERSEVQAINEKLQANQAELQTAIEALEAKSQELQDSQGRLQEALTETERLKEAAERAQDETLREYFSYLAGAARNARLEEDDATRRRLLALAWPNWLEVEAEIRIPETALEGLPEEYAVELLLSEMTLGDSLESLQGKEFAVGDTETTLFLQMIAADPAGRWLAAIVDDYSRLLVVDLQNGRGTGIENEAFFDAIAADDEGRLLLSVEGEGIVSLDPVGAAFDPSALWEGRSLLYPAELVTGLLVDAARGRLLALTAEGVAAYSWPPDGDAPQQIAAVGAPLPFPPGDLWTSEPPAEIDWALFATEPTLYGEGRYLLARNADGALSLWDLEQGAWAGQTVERDIRTYGLSEDERYLVTAGALDAPDVISVFDLAEGRLVGSLEAPVWFDELPLDWVIDFRVRGAGDSLTLEILEPYGLWTMALDLSGGGMQVGQPELASVESDLLLGLIGTPAIVVADEVDYDLATVVPFGGSGRGTADGAPLFAIAPGGARAVEVVNGGVVFHARTPQGTGFAATASGDALPCLDGSIRSLSLAAGEGPLMAVVKGDDPTPHLCLFWERDGAVEGGVAPLPDPSLELDHAALSPEGRALAFIEGGSLSLWRLQRSSGKETKGALDCDGQEAEAVSLGTWSATFVCSRDVAEDLQEVEGLAVGREGGPVVAVSATSIATWEKELTNPQQIAFEDLYAWMRPRSVAISEEGGFLLTISEGRAALVDLCQRRVVHRFLTTGEVDGGGFVAGAGDGCDLPDRQASVWLRDTTGIVARWTLTQEERSRRVVADFGWLQRVAPAAQVMPLDSGDRLVLAEEGVRVERVPPAAIPANPDELRDLVDLLLVSVPTAESGMLDRSVFILPAAVGKAQGASEAMEGESLAAACLRLGDLALVTGGTVAPADAERICQQAVEEGAVAPAVATLYGRLLMASGSHEPAEDVLLLAAAAGDRGALWSLAALEMEYGSPAMGMRLFEAVAEGDPLAEWQFASGLSPAAAHGLSEEALAGRADAGDPLAMVALGQARYVTWGEGADRQQAIEAFKHFIRASLAIRSLPGEQTHAVRGDLDRLRLELAAALTGDRKLLAGAWQEALQGHAAGRSAGLSRLSAGGEGVLVPASIEARQEAALAAAEALTNDPSLGAAFQDLWLKKLLQAPPTQEPAAAEARFALLAALLQRDDPLFLLDDASLPGTLVGQLTRLSRVAFDGDATRAQDVLDGRLSVWLDGGLADPAAWLAPGSQEERVFWCFALAVQREALASGRLEPVKAGLPPLLHWLQRSIYVPEEFAACPGDPQKPVWETRELATGSGDPVLATMGEAFAFALAAWHAGGDPDDFQPLAELSRSLAEKLRRFEGPEETVAGIIAMRVFGDSLDYAIYNPFWPEGNEDLEALAGEIAYVIQWAAERVPGPMLLESLGHLRSWEARFHERGASQDPALATEARHRAGEALLAAGRLGADRETMLDLAGDEFSTAIRNATDGGDMAAVERGFQALARMLEALRDEGEAGTSAWYGVLHDLYEAWIQNRELPVPADRLFAYLQRSDRLAGEGAAWDADPAVAYNRRIGVISLLATGAWQAQILPGRAEGGIAAGACDEASAYAYDPLRLAPAMGFDRLDETSLEACREAYERHPDEPRFAYLLGRNLLAAYEKRGGDIAQFAEAVAFYRRAAEAGYPAGLIGLALEFSYSGYPYEAADFAEAALDAALPYLGEPLGRSLLSSSLPDARAAGADLLRQAAGLGVAPAVLLLAEGLADGRIALERPGEAYARALIAARLFAAAGDWVGEGAARRLAGRLAATLDEATIAAARREAEAFVPRGPMRPDFGQIDLLLPAGEG